VRVLREAMQLPSTASLTVATLGMALARAGEVDEARAHLAALEREAARGYVSPVVFATIHLGLGNATDALDWAERAVEERRGWPVYFRVNPLLDPVRGEARFQAIVRGLGLGE